MNPTYSNIPCSIAPSLICMDLCNLERDVHRLETLGCKMLHVDVLDGRYSPSMPIGLDTIRQLRQRTNMIFDAHVMSTANDFFVNQMIDIGAERICFQLESQPVPGPLIHAIRSHGRQAGIALAPPTPLSALEYLIEDCDYVLLMQIDPGYAFFPGQTREAYMLRKIEELQALIEKRNPHVTIEVDGRVDFDSIPVLLERGVKTFVSGTRGVFAPGTTWEQNWQKLHDMLINGGQTG